MPDPTVASEAGSYWDGVLETWRLTPANRLWRAHSDAVNTMLLRRWLPPVTGSLLKTDLFDEAVGEGLIPELAARADEVMGLDISPAAVHAAAARYPELDARVGNVLALPFPDRRFDIVVSNSTLDHFDSVATLDAAVAELARVLRPGGSLIITLDNRSNPIVALRTSVASGALRRLGVVPYFVGATYGSRGLSGSLQGNGLTVFEMTAIMHCPPRLAASLTASQNSRSIDKEEIERHVRRVLRFELMERWPTRMVSGHFVGALAVRD